MTERTAAVTRETAETEIKLILDVLPADADAPPGYAAAGRLTPV
jgi:imidazoleglycerol phosphate dehydratase HisB